MPTPYYDDGKGIVIWNCDCRDVLPTMEAGSANLVLTDPPYGISYVHGARKGGVLLGCDGVAIRGDNRPFNLPALLGLGQKVVLWGANHYANSLPASPGWLVWDKRGAKGINDQSDCELAWTNFLTTARVYYRQWNGAVRGGREQAEGRVHPAQKPVALFAWCIGKAVLGPNALVVDPFMGSGTTLVAAKELGLRALGMELEERYCEIAAKRLSQQIMFAGQV